MSENHPTVEKKAQPPLPIGQMEVHTELAHKYPRSIRKITDECTIALKEAPEFASKAYYSIPYKNSFGGTEMVEGPSIKAAMELARSWRNCVNAGQIVEDSEDRVLVQGMFWDFEANEGTLRQVSVPKKTWSKKMQRVIPVREDRLNIMIQAGISKAVRNAILASLPAYIVDGYFKFAKKQALLTLDQKKNGKKAESRLDRCVSKFKPLGVTKEQIQEYMAGSSRETEDEVFEDLLGIFTAIKDGQKKAEEVFGGNEKEEPKGPISAESVFK
jgi:hypothetical protein